MSGFKLKSSGKKKGIMMLTGELGMQDAANLKQAFLDAMDKHKELSVDLSGVESCHIAILQILAAVHASLKSRGGELGSEGEFSSAVVEEINAAGLAVGASDKRFWRRG